MQTTSHLLMIRPVNFGFNPETAGDNRFQLAAPAGDVQEKARAEFDGFVMLLRDRGVDVTVVEDTAEPHTPDAIFPNNWVSFHRDGTVLLYPMMAANRRRERKRGVLDSIALKFAIRATIDLSPFELEGRFLEGTGSMVLDRDNKIAYACRSPRTDLDVLDEFCRKMRYKPVLFSAVDESDQPIYHTNVMMCVADRYVVICLAAISAKKERDIVSSSIGLSGKEIIPITTEQMQHFAGNMLQVQNNLGEKLLVMSSQAYRSLNPEQVEQLTGYNSIVHAPLETIETNGGGSARCMMAEVHLPLK